MHLGTLLTLPLLAAAVPAAPLSGQAPFQPSSYDPEISIDLDLDDLRLVRFAENEQPVWVTELQKIEAKAAGRNFMDITDTPKLGMSTFLRPKKSSKHKYTKPGKHSKDVKAFQKNIDVKHMEKFLSKFTSFKTRYYRSQTGKDSQRFLQATLSEISNLHEAGGIKVSEFPHSWGQNSLIVRFPAENPKGPVTIVAAHQDSTNMWPFLPAPGADDDGSGTTSILEAYKSLSEGNFTSTNPLEFHWYSAEEGGLLGSQAVAKDYEARGVDVNAMIQMDMTAWVKRGSEEVIGIVTDFVDPDLTSWLTMAVDAYCDIPAVETKCGYACSDHASWTQAGYQSSFSIESKFEDSNKNIHSTNDRMDISDEFSIKHMAQFSKLAIAFAVELSS
ncbi:hypothetical protein CcaverHIS002_0100180 [Cutaneotrichosporon cavernicola]|uniref:Peptide hydrolase n=1 Tax=Cutaneotrichosporon cavernicola TaxID=279322 RepID=A0AA48ICT7_9TREE|nr:uncharacterized protein CcaverHIS019_0100160 [Cutaneotrichosporon cavernicola]BEI79489.1 hypothetical protein CcaverHIS002_0100180 [Cutaneotrichosporon cavernicola]BEI87298.1 hypothetical protein CcaverHIS019_0100160 [Cutaneotrichosporon cavernicola]BEI95068.1 hypothetical protein CcaverHIS631_0100170 [Cutaneotrichosporon cavernicola]BEJ02842.1 hypothetical protein CcaverHIS641_0100170 [Cutaneotrichosporon cavernicola]